MEPQHIQGISLIAYGIMEAIFGIYKEGKHQVLLKILRKWNCSKSISAGSFLDPNKYFSVTTMDWNK